MQFLHFDFIHAIIVILFVSVVFWVVFLQRLGNIARQDESKNYMSNVRYFRVRLASLFLAIILLSLALLRPMGSYGGDISERKGMDCIWILDVSSSMNVRDITEGNTNLSRLEKAKSIIENFMLAHPENRYGLVIFAMKARLVSPLTSESSSLLTFLASIDSKSISGGGTNFYEALKTALNRLGSTDTHGEESNMDSAIMVLLSDGGDKEDLGDTSNLKTLFRDKDTSLFAIGVGSEQGGPIPVGTDPSGNAFFKQYQGETIVSKLSIDNLHSLADIGKGKYIASEYIPRSLEKSLANITLRSIAGESVNNGDMGRWFVLVGFIFFLVFLLFPSSFLKTGSVS